MSEVHSAPELGIMQAGPFVAGRNAHPGALALKRGHLRDPHVAPINDLADAIADAEGIARGLVPYVDPQLGGIHARVLALLDNPSTKAEAGTGSGLLSLENDDRSAKNCAAFYNDIGLGPELLVHWNVAPAPISGEKNSGSSIDERERGAVWLQELVALLPNLKVVLLMGDNARDGWKRSGLTLPKVVIPEAVPHPSQRGLNNADGRVRLRRALLETNAALEGRSEKSQEAMAKQIASAARTMSTELAPQRESPLGNATGEWAWWPTFEHYCAPGSTPWGVSASCKTVERALDHHDAALRKWGVIAKRSAKDWTLVARRKNGRTVQLDERQIVKYDAARVGGSRGNLGPVPPANQIQVQTRDLDR